MKNLEKATPIPSKIKFDESEDDESSSEDEEEIEQELADVTFEELQKARSDGSHTVYRKLNSDKKGGRANKNRPMEASAKKPVGRFREIIQVPKKVVRDPRFETLCGRLDEEGFKKRYNFLYANNLPAERQELEKSLKKTKDPNVVGDLKNRISLIDKQIKSALPKRTDKHILVEHKKKEREAAKQGKQPFYLKNSEIRKQGLVEQYEKLKASGKLESFLKKKRKRNAAKDQRFMPYRRSDTTEQ